MRAPRRPLAILTPFFGSMALFAFAGAAVPAEPSPRPRLVLDRTSHDFGTAKQNADLKAEFTVKNGGDAVLHVTEVHGDCGCATASISSDAVPAGQFAKIACVFHTMTLSGPQTKTIRVVSDDPDAKETQLKLSVDVSAGIVLDPPLFALGTVLVGVTPTATVVAKWKDGAGKAFKVLGVDAANLADAVFATKPFDAPPWHGTSVTLSFSKPPPAGTIFSIARIRTDDAENPALEANIGGTVSTKVYLSQRVVTVGLVREGVGAKRHVLCRGFDSAIDLGDLTVSSRRGVVTASAARDPERPGHWAIEITLPENAPAGSVDDIVEVKTKVPGEEISEIRIVGTVLAATK